MIHARIDYDRIQDPALADPILLGEDCTPIAEDEPVIVFRAQDENFVDILGYYRMALIGRGFSPESEIVDSLNRHVLRAREWQQVNGKKTPDLPPGAVRP